MLKTCDPIVTRFEPPIVGKARSRSLVGLSFVAKDGFDVSGHVTGAGCPEWARSSGAATKTAPVINSLLNAGALLVGKAQMDELAYSLMGVNARYGTPLNPAAPDRVPGGSSSGSAASVAAGLADIGLGSDTGGSVRLPASFCGVFGLRPTHGSLSGENLVPLAPSYDTPGFFTSDLATMAAVVAVFQGSQASVEPSDFWLPSDLWSLAQDGVAAALRAALPAGSWRSDSLLPKGDFEDWLKVFRIHQGYEIWQQHGQWITATQPDFGPGIRERFSQASAITKEEFDMAVDKRADIRKYLQDVVTPATILVFPTSPDVAPLRTTPEGDLETFRSAALKLLCVAGHAGLPQLSIPLALHEGAPLGLSFVGARGTDAQLITATREFLTQVLGHKGTTVCK